MKHHHIFDVFSLQLKVCQKQDATFAWSMTLLSYRVFPCSSLWQNKVACVCYLLHVSFLHRIWFKWVFFSCISKFGTKIFLRNQNPSSWICSGTVFQLAQAPHEGVGAHTSAAEVTGSRTRSSQRPWTQRIFTGPWLAQTAPFHVCTHT